MLSRKYLTVIGVVALAFASGCGDCLTIGIPPLIVTVADDRTNQSVLAGSTVIAIVGESRDTITVPTTDSRSSVSIGCCHGGGAYTVIVKRPGYLEASRGNIQVEEERCGHPKTVTVHMRLTPTTG